MLNVLNFVWKFIFELLLSVDYHEIFENWANSWIFLILQKKKREINTISQEKTILIFNKWIYICFGVSRKCIFSVNRKPNVFTRSLFRLFHFTESLLFLCTFVRTNERKTEIECKWGGNMYIYQCMLSAVLMRIYQLTR